MAATQAHSIESGIPFHHRATSWHMNFTYNSVGPRAYIILATGMLRDSFFPENWTPLPPRNANNVMLICAES